MFEPSDMSAVYCKQISLKTLAEQGFLIKLCSRHLFARTDRINHIPKQ